MVARKQKEEKAIDLVVDTKKGKSTSKPIAARKRQAEEEVADAKKKLDALRLVVTRAKLNHDIRQHNQQSFKVHKTTISWRPSGPNQLAGVLKP